MIVRIPSIAIKLNSLIDVYPERTDCSRPTSWQAKTARFLFQQVEMKYKMECRTNVVIDKQSLEGVLPPPNTSMEGSIYHAQAAH